MARAFVTCLTQKRRPHLEQRRLYRTVRIVAVGAVLGDRLVFPEERPSILRMAAGAGLVDRVFHQLRGRRRAVRRMAGRAGHLALAQRMPRQLVEVGVLGLVTAGTDFDLAGCGLHRILGGMQLMAARARDIPRRMRARGPIMRGVRLVAPQTIRVLLLHGEWDLGPKAMIPQRYHPSHRHAHRPARGRPRTAARRGRTGRADRRAGVLGVKYGHDGGIAGMTSETGVGSLRAVGRGSMRGVLVRDTGRYSSRPDLPHPAEQQDQRNGGAALNPGHSATQRTNGFTAISITGSSRACGPRPHRPPPQHRDKAHKSR